MATSSRVQFNLNTLRKKAIESIDFRIAQAKLDAESFQDDDALTELVVEWRQQQEQRICDLCRQLGEDGIDNYRLSSWKIEPMPEVDLWGRQRTERELSVLKDVRSRVVAKSGSLVPDKDGNIALTKTQLRDFFGL